MDIKTETAFLLKANAAYHKGKPIITDAQFDIRRDRLLKADPSNILGRMVGAKVTKKEVKLPVPAGSLTKYTPETILSWVENQDVEQFFIGPKLDGLGLTLIYKGGDFKQAMTRGDGVMGQDVTHNAQYIQGVRKVLKSVAVERNGISKNPAKTVLLTKPLFNRAKGTVIVRGEVVIHESIFEKVKAKTEYSASRNFVGGMLNSKEANPDLLRKITFVAFSCWTLKDGQLVRFPYKHIELLFLSSNGFTTIQNPSRTVSADIMKRFSKISRGSDFTIDGFRDYLPVHNPDLAFSGMYVDAKNITADFIKARMDYFKSKCDIKQDGLVIEPTDIKYGVKRGLATDGLTPKGTVCIKLNAAEQEHRVAKIYDIEWNLSPRGLFKPTLIFKDTLDFYGVKVDRTTGDNYEAVKSQKLGKGAVVHVVRSGDVIPKIVKIVKKSDEIHAPRLCPHCDSKTKSNGTDLRCVNKKCPGVVRARMHHFAGHLKTDGMAAGMVDALIDEGFTSIDKILDATPRQLKRIEGFGSSKIKIVTEDFRKTVKEASLSKLMHASACFSDDQAALGTTRLDAIITTIGQAKILEGDISKIEGKLVGMNGVGQRTVNLFIRGLPRFRKFLSNLGSAAPSFKERKGKFSGKVAVWTGYRSKDQEKAWEAKGGLIGSSVSSRTDILFYASKDGLKFAKAKKLGVDIVSKDKADAYIA